MFKFKICLINSAALSSMVEHLTVVINGNQNVAGSIPAADFLSFFFRKKIIWGTYLPHALLFFYNRSIYSNNELFKLEIKVYKSNFQYNERRRSTK